MYIGKENHNLVTHPSLFFLTPPVMQDIDK